MSTTDDVSHLKDKPFPTRLVGYLRLTGPGYMQSAMTLGGGSIASCAALGSMFGYKYLWVQIVAMMLGFVVLAGVSVYSGLGMRFRSEISDLAPSSIAKSLARIEDNFGISNSLLLLVSIDREGEEERLVDFARGLEKALVDEPTVLIGVLQQAQKSTGNPVAHCLVPGDREEEEHHLELFFGYVPAVVVGRVE